MQTNTSDKAQITAAIKEVNQYRDLGLWGKLEDYFVENPYIDDQTITKELPGVRHIKALINNWRRELSTYFYATRHIVDRIRIKNSNRKEAVVEAATTGKYFIADRGQRYVLTIIGTSTYKLVKKAGQWKIGDVRFTLENQSLSPVGA